MHHHYISASRIKSNPIITPGMLQGDDGANINGPSLIRVPEWIREPLGAYYLYFAHHKGTYIRMAHADSIEGPWKICHPGVLQQRDTVFGEGPVDLSHWTAHIASPEVIVDNDSQRLLMYFHGFGPKLPGCHCTAVAVSESGLAFRMLPGTAVIPDTYFRVFDWQGVRYLIGRLGVLYSISHDMSTFEAGPNPFQAQRDQNPLRHCGVIRKDSTLFIFYSRIGDQPERIVVSAMDLAGDWHTWQAGTPVTVLEPGMTYEGADLALAPSKVGWAKNRVRQLRDPAVFMEDDRYYLLYSVAGEHGIAIAELTW